MTHEEKVNFESVSDIQRKFVVGYSVASRIQEAVKELIASAEKKGREEAEKDVESVLEEVSKVYCELTNGKLSKPSYTKEVIVSEIDSCYEKLYEEQIKESWNEAIEEIIRRCNDAKRV